MAEIGKPVGEDTEKADPPPGEGALLVEERVGRLLGKAFQRVRRIGVWRKAAQAYQDGLAEGSDVKRKT